MSPEPTPHYHYGSGSYGCIYDYGPHHADTVEDAVSDLAALFHLGRDRRRALTRTRHLDLDARRDGASYCDITECHDETCGAQEAYP